MNKESPNPFLRGMGGTDDFIAEQFMPSALYRLKQLEMVQWLLASGLDSEEVACMFAVPFDMHSSGKDTAP